MTVDDQHDGQLTVEEIRAGLSNLGRCASGNNFAYLDLQIWSMRLKDISAIRDFKHLQSLDCSHNNLNDLSALGALPYLTRLNASHNQLTRILDFKPPLNLREADFSNNAISVMNDISGHRFLISLNLDGNRIRSISGVSNLECLKTLSLNRNRIRHISGLGSIPLKQLYLNSNQLVCIENMDKMQHLQTFEIEENTIASLEGTAELVMLTTLNARNNQIRHLSEISFLEKLPLLSYLSLEANPITQLPCYRLLVLQIVQQLETLDSTDVCAEEKVASINFHDPEHAQYNDTKRDDAQDLPPAIFGAGNANVTEVKPSNRTALINNSSPQTIH